MVHPERLTEYDTFCALRSTLSDIFIDHIGKVETSDFVDWQVLSVEYQDLNAQTKEITMARLNPVATVERLGQTEYIGGVWLPRTFQDRYFIIRKSGLAECFLADQEEECEADWETAEQLLKIIEEAHTLARLT